MMTFSERLNWCKRQGKLTDADIARWVRRSYPTVRNWAERGAAPRGPRAESVLVALTKLQEAITKKRGFPVPDELSALERPNYIERLRDGNGKTVPRSRSAKKRLARRRHHGGKPKRRKEAKNHPAASAAG